MTSYSFHHVHLLSTDAVAAARFYEAMFGATFTESKGANGLPRCHVDIGGQLILISTADDRAGEAATGPHSQMGLDHIGIRVPRTEAARRRVQGRTARVPSRHPHRLSPRTGRCQRRTGGVPVASYRVCLSS